MDNEEIISQIENFLDRKKMKKYELARYLNTTEANISRWVNRKHKVSRGWLEILKSRGVVKEV